MRELLQASLEQRPPRRAAVAHLNKLSATSRQWLELSPEGAAQVRTSARTPAAAALAAIAADAIELVGTERGADLRACGAPGCVLLFVVDHPRRQWCSPACGNRARQARHYAHRRAERAG